MNIADYVLMFIQQLNTKKLVIVTVNDIEFFMFHDDDMTWKFFPYYWPIHKILSDQYKQICIW